MTDAGASALASGLRYCMGYAASAVGPAWVGPLTLPAARGQEQQAEEALAGAAAAEGGAAAGCVACGASACAAGGAAGGFAVLGACAGTGILLGVAAAAATIAGPLIQLFCGGSITDPKCLHHDRCAGDCDPRNGRASYVVVTERGIGKIYYYFFTCRSAAEAAMNSWHRSRILYDISKFSRGPQEQIARGAKMSHNTIRGAMGRMLRDAHSEMQEMLGRDS
eukprot:TRINITY_DN559_c0_g1_i8.p1 TRINITY_DN559_c0_g1~~TRINITY_DN559_c0_g1_i8.p1  ORF type:complete len:222 (-),score=33.53 TRINITY_DN559_c0_g1_i8:54-719(-)